jgi:Flp pilus assembly protein TadG
MSGQPRLPNSPMWRAVRGFMVEANGISGAAMVEFTVFAPILLSIAIYTMDFGLLMFSKMEVQNAAQAGAQYAIVNNGYDSSAISSAVTNATKFTAVTPTSSQFCGCPSATRVTFCSASCDTCNTGTCSLSVQGHYVTVTATPTTTYTPLIRFGLVASSYDISATSTVRIR